MRLFENLQDGLQESLLEILGNPGRLATLTFNGFNPRYPKCHLRPLEHHGALTGAQWLLLTNLPGANALYQEIWAPLFGLLVLRVP